MTYTVGRQIIIHSFCNIILSAVSNEINLHCFQTQAVKKFRL